MPLESDFEPELEGKVVAGFISEVRTQFPGVALSQNLRTQMKSFCQIGYVITILCAVALELRLNQVVGVWSVKVKVFEPAGVHLDKPRCVLLRRGNKGRDILKV